MDKIQRESPLSFKLLQLMSYLDPVKIPKKLIKCASFLKNESTVQFKCHLQLVHEGATKTSTYSEGTKRIRQPPVLHQKCPCSCHNYSTTKSHKIGLTFTSAK
jgi:hypothetical protein